MNLDEILASALSNPSFFEEMYALYQTSPQKVEASWRDLFGRMDAKQIISPVKLPKATVTPSSKREQIPSARASSSDQTCRIQELIHAYRRWGHLKATLNPLATAPPPIPPQLSLESLGFHPEEMLQPFPTCGLLMEKTAPLKTLIQRLETIYCGTIGWEYVDLQGPAFEAWMQQQIEQPSHDAELTLDQKQQLLQQLNKSELFESFLHTRYVGQKRFSLEGAETLIPMLSSLIERAASLGVEEFVIGMPHRGRLNVLSNIMNKRYTEVFAEFEENYIPDTFEGSGDVKYHKGFSSEILTSQGHRVQIQMAANPSHLESVDPVVAGLVRGRQELNHDLSRHEKVLPILLHGDAGLAGQGVVYETLQFSGLEGYATGGTLHFVVNNQIGFTTLPEEGRSTLYCTDIAKTFGFPVFHVNAEDPEACLFVTRLAMDIRKKFHLDVFIDLNGYRKYGHNESDEPAFTQPIEHALIRQKKSIREIYRDRLIQQGVLEKFLSQQMEEEFKKGLTQALKGTQSLIENNQQRRSNSKAPSEEPSFSSIDTAVNLKSLQEVAAVLCAIPEGFQAHPKVAHLMKEKLKMVDPSSEVAVDWGMAETLAYGTLLTEGISIRLSGQDTCRGTFSHRHAVWVDQNNEKRYVPLAHLKKDQGTFSVYNSPLSEYASLAFELGYTLGSPKTMVIWEAQFGDFCNGAQVVLDQYISTAQQKWGQHNDLVLLLPHGYEGQGPEHSSARIERFLTLAGSHNMRIVYPSTPVQFFHLLRRQALTKGSKPLIVFTPKGLLRHPLCVSSIEEFSSSHFEPILDDLQPPKRPKRLAFCTGRIFYDLLTERSRIKDADLVLIRVEQLYPFDSDRVSSLIKKYSGIQEYLWIQEEPRNMGAWAFMLEALQPLLPSGKALRYIGRPRCASPAVGAYALHKKEHAALINEVFPIKEEPPLNVHALHRV